MSDLATTYLSVKGTDSAVSNVRQAVKPGDGGDFFDFEHFIPFPAVFDTISSPVDVVQTAAEAEVINAQFSKQHAEMYAPEDVPRRAITQEENNQLMADHGANDWFEWANKHWGVKSNSEEANIMLDEANHFVVCFKNIWTAPRALMDYIATLDGVEDVQYLTFHPKESWHGDMWSSDEVFRIFDLGNVEQISVRKS